MAPPTGDSVAVKPVDRQPAPPAATRPAMPTAPQGEQVPADPKVAEFAGLRAPKLATWIWRPLTRARRDVGVIAEYAVPGRDGSDQAHITVFKLKPATLEENLKRWRGQFKSADDQPVEPKIETFEVDGMPVTLVEFAGQYQGAGAPSFVPDQLFITAIIQAPAGQLFVRFVGPAGTVEPTREPFMEMIRNLRRVEPEK
ncbi:MAG: hypothetical protein L0219_04525 [Phycisphaerales bacterium]|nr:hypothetical protein [Phycisphaerales bacterium]